jgi:hypothetical protein
VPLPRPENSDVTGLDNAVARIGLTEIQHRLPQRSCGREDGIFFARPRITRGDRMLAQPAPQRLMCINWADLGPGFSWIEEYHVTWLPGFDRQGVTRRWTAQACAALTDWAIGWFSGNA